MSGYTKKHKEFLEKLGTDIEKLRNLSPSEKEMFTDNVLIPYVCGKGTKEEEDLADDIIDIMKSLRKSSDEYREIAVRTMHDVECGYFYRGKRKVKLADFIQFSQGDYSSVEVLSPDKLRSILTDEDDFFAYSFWGSEKCNFYLTDADSFEAASSFDNPLVMNFASAKNPGGGFLNGACAQEEALCRCSTLYASLSSPKAREMYDYNRKHALPDYSDYMLLSPNVCVFKDLDGNYLDAPFTCGVMTVAAPNGNGPAAALTEDELRSSMEYRLRLFLYACARNNYRNLVLGAWGCGAFGNDPDMVADIFHELFFGERKLYQFFDNVVFAIYGGGRNYDAFARAFDGITENCPKDCVKQEEPLSLIAESKYNCPVCNHSPENITDDNIGYTFGVLSDGVPFEAEKWTCDGTTNVSVYLPDLHLQREDKNVTHTDGNVLPFEVSTEQKHNSILGTGMVIREPDTEHDAKPYIDYLIKAGVVTFTGAVLNGGIMLLCDEEGNDIVCVHISLDGVYNGPAETPLHFREFPGAHRKKSRITEIIINKNKT